MWRTVVFYFFIRLIEIGCFSDNNRTVLISKYAKVSHWMPTAQNFTQGVQRRINNNGENVWSYRSDGNSQGQQLNKAARVIYQYPVYKNTVAKVDYGKVEKIPAVGEVIQDRFNPRPYFDYGKVPPKSEVSASYGPPNPTSAPPMRQAPPPPSNLFPAVFNVPPSPSKPPIDLYTSPYSSYNPPNQNQKQGNDADSYPPLDSYAAPPLSDGNGPYPDKPVDMGSATTATLGPPLAAKDEIDAPPSDHAAKPDDGPPNYPPKDEHDIYYPPDDYSGGHVDMPPADQMPMDQMMDDHMPIDQMPMSMDQMPMDQMPMNQMPMDQMPMMMDQAKDVGDHGFPHYLYEGHDADHHVYEEVHHTTTPAPVKEDKRVSTTNYSYYYLGRKLWYIPLYFSIYFMIYVTVLILKAIARHKVELKNEWATANTRNARQMNFHENLKTVDDFHRNVSAAIEKFDKTYSDIAM